MIELKLMHMGKVDRVLTFQNKNSARAEYHRQSDYIWQYCLVVVDGKELTTKGAERFFQGRRPKKGIRL